MDQAEKVIKLWNQLQKTGKILGYKNYGLTYDIYLNDGLVNVISCNGESAKMTIDTFLYIWS